MNEATVTVGKPAEHGPYEVHLIVGAKRTNEGSFHSLKEAVLVARLLAAEHDARLLWGESPEDKGGAP
jgi:hypothetical protein